MRFDGKVVLVTGAAVGGMGRAAAQLFALEGAMVVVADIDSAAADDAVKEIADTGGSAQAYQVDLRDRPQVFSMIDEIVATSGGLDVLANVAGIYPHASFEDMSEEFFNDVLAIDLKGPMFACQAAVHHMAARGGVIVNVASGAAFYGIKGLAAYSAAKGGLVAMSRVLAVEAGPKVRVNVVAPGSTAHPGRQSLLTDTPVSRDLPLTTRWLSPSEVAEVIVWCASAEASGVNGALIRVGARRML